jgi:hypothetical protein
MVCNSCKKEKKDFYKGNHVCVSCFKIRRYAHRRNNPKLRFLASAKHRAKTEKAPFNLKPEDFEIPEFCPVLGIKLKFNFGVGGFKENSPTLDRFIPKLGYVKNNVQIISFRANRLKGDATTEEVEKLLQWMKLCEEASN